MVRTIWFSVLRRKLRPTQVGQFLCETLKALGSFRKSVAKTSDGLGAQSQENASHFKYLHGLASECLKVSKATSSRHAVTGDVPVIYDARLAVTGNVPVTYDAFDEAVLGD